MPDDIKHERVHRRPQSTVQHKQGAPVARPAADPLLRNSTQHRGLAPDGESSRFDHELERNTLGEVVAPTRPLIVVANAEGYVLLTNAAMQHASGYTLEEMRRKPWFEVCICEPDRERVRQSFRRIATGAVATDQIAPMQTRDQGQVLVQWRGRRLIGHDATTDAVLLVGTTPVQFREGDARRRRVEANVKSGSFEVRLPRPEIFWSPELYRIAERKPEEGPVPLLDLLRRLAPDDRKRLVSYLRDTDGRSGGYDSILRLRCPSRSFRFVHLIIERNSDEGGALLGWFGVVHDVTERRRLESEARQAERLDAVAALAGGIAHDFSNILMSLIGCLDLARSHVAPDSAAFRFLVDSRKVATEGVEVVRKISSLAGPAKPRHKAMPTHLDRFVTKWFRAFGSKLSAKIQVRLKLSAPGWSVVVDRQEVQGILSNLVSNAAEAMPDGGLLVVATELRFVGRSVGRIELSVRDTGIGMEPEATEQIFEPFCTTKHTGRGRGLGLCEVYSIIRRCGGSIAVDSEVGRGTSVNCVLPSIRAEVLVSGSLAQREDRVAGSGRTVLVVEDDSQVRLSTRAYLQALGYRVLGAIGTQEVCSVLRGRGCEVDVALTDVVIPDDSGALVVEKIRRMGRRCPFIFVSARPAELLERSGKIPKGSRTLLQPLTPDELARELRRVPAG